MRPRQLTLGGASGPSRRGGRIIRTNPATGDITGVNCTYSGCPYNDPSDGCQHLGLFHTETGRSPAGVGSVCKRCKTFLSKGWKVKETDERAAQRWSEMLEAVYSLGVATGLMSAEDAWAAEKLLHDRLLEDGRFVVVNAEHPLGYPPEGTPQVVHYVYVRLYRHGSDWAAYVGTTSDIYRRDQEHAEGRYKTTKPYEDSVGWLVVRV